ncbi:hypothetical protein B0H14DRAFT_3147667 [Mycena olivaceomarginata]|nr:hypothetical protein B0H14DRAFT_3147667 [Mycena olivaceomarginata]
MFIFHKPLTPPGPFRHLPMGLLLSSVVVVLSSMIGVGFLVARRSGVPQKKDGTPPFSTVGGLKLVTRSELLLEADNTSRTEPELPRVKTEESDAMLSPAPGRSSGRPLDGLSDREDLDSFETGRAPTKNHGDYWPLLSFQNTESTVAHPDVLTFNMNHQPYCNVGTQLVPSSLSFRLKNVSQTDPI